MSIVDQMDALRHMLGMASNVPMKSWGWRNYFNTGDEGDDLENLQAMEAQGLVELYRRNYYRATELGMRAVGLPAKARDKLLASQSDGGDVT